MSEKKANATIQQYEPPRVPGTWDYEGKRFAQRLLDIFDDIYRRFGRLGLTDLNKTLRSQITTAIDEAGQASSSIEQLPGQIIATVKETITDDLEGRVHANETAIEQLPDTIKATVNENGVQTAQVMLDQNGVSIKSAVGGVNNSVELNGDGVTIGSTGSLKAEAGGFVGIKAGDSSNSYINLGSVFSASSSDGVTATKAEFAELIVNGKRITGNTISQFPIYFSTVQPPARNCVWLKPVAGGSSGLASTTYSLAISGTGSANYLPSGTTKSYQLTSANAAASGGSQYVYKISFTVNNLSPSGNQATGTLTASIGSTTVGSFSINLGVNQSKVCEDTIVLPTNLCPSSAVTLSIRSTCSGAVYLKSGTAIMLDVTSNASGGGGSDTAPLCEVHFVY